ncbi:MAG: hypothetical protein HY748_05495 [Elusimicrobia bacterium]|nr:hypothetical protein [Elusimicrobiota bacterium]
MPETDPIFEAVKAAVVSRLKDDPQAQLHVGPIILELVRAELEKPGAATKRAMAEACHGAMSALLLLDKDLCVGAVEVLKGLTHILQERSGDPMQTMDYALEGISRIGASISSGLLSDIEHHIETEFMGAGEHFSRHAEKYHKKG